MKDKYKTKKQLLGELEELKQQLAKLSKPEETTEKDETEPTLLEGLGDQMKKTSHILEENQDIISYLKETRLFSHLPERLFEQLIPLSELLDLPIGSEILKEGEKNSKVYFLVRGKVGVYAGGQLIIQLRRQGDIFGEMSIISNKPCTASIIAETPIRLFSIQAKDIGKYTDIDADTLNHTLYRIFSMILTEKLGLTTFKAKEYEETHQQLLREIAERRQLEEELKKNNIDLLTINQQLKQTQTQLIQSAKLASLGEMATGIAHELNQPLFAISMTAEDLIEESDQRPPEETNLGLEKILNLVDRTSKIINHLQAFGRNTETSSYEPNNINQIIQDTFTLLNKQLRFEGIQLSRKLSRKELMVNCDALQIEQILNNLILNAKDALENSSEKKITIRSFLREKQVIIEVEDTGPGIPEEILQKIFDPFFTTKEVGKGTGLGLSIAHGFVEKHQGTIEAVSEPGKGALFRLSLPFDRRRKSL